MLLEDLDHVLQTSYVGDQVVVCDRLCLARRVLDQVGQDLASGCHLRYPFGWDEGAGFDVCYAGLGEPAYQLEFVFERD